MGQRNPLPAPASAARTRVRCLNPAVSEALVYGASVAMQRDDSARLGEAVAWLSRPR